VLSDKEELQLHTLITLYCCTLCCQTERRSNCTHYYPCIVAHCAVRQKGVTAAHITNPVLLHTVLSDREEVQLHTLLPL